MSFARFAGRSICAPTIACHCVCNGVSALSMLLLLGSPYQTPIWDTKARVADERHGSRITRGNSTVGGGTNAHHRPWMSFRLSKPLLYRRLKPNMIVAITNAQGTWRDAPLSLNFRSIMSK